MKKAHELRIFRMSSYLGYEKSVPLVSSHQVTPQRNVLHLISYLRCGKIGKDGILNMR
jgi:hypothetical protein